MTVFYPYTATKDDGIELKYSIRSIVKYFKDFDGIILVGDRPTWFKGFHLQHSDIEKRKEYSVYRKLLSAYSIEQAPMLLCHDDCYALQPFGADMPNYYRGTCTEAITRTVERRFKDMFAACLPNWMNFEIHCPMVIDPSKIRDEDRDFLLKTTYANRLKLPGTDIADCKVRGWKERSEIRDEIKDRPFFSTADNVNAAMLDVLNDIYPGKSQYEI